MNGDVVSVKLNGKIYPVGGSESRVVEGNRNIRTGVDSIYYNFWIDERHIFHLRLVFGSLGPQDTIRRYKYAVVRSSFNLSLQLTNKYLLRPLERFHSEQEIEFETLREGFNIVLIEGTVPVGVDTFQLV